MTYDEALAYLHAFPDFERGTAGEEILTLDRMRRLLELLDHPDRVYGIAHVVGTKGKGSTAAMIASCLRAAGYRTGLFTSPHLVDYRERIRVDGALISPDTLAAIVDDTLRPAVERLRAAGERTPLHFELQCALAFTHFRRTGVQVAVVEAGLGGRLDATNAVSTVAETVITTIGYDHMAILGDTLDQIATEKAAVVRPGGYVVSAPQPPDALAVVERVCRERDATLSLVGRDWRVENVVERTDDTVFSLRGPEMSYEGLRVPLPGAHQAINAAVAVAALSDLRRDYPRLDEAAVRYGLAATRWAGRLQTVARAPLTILDAAHNRESATALAGALHRLYPGQSFVLVMAVFRDKNVRDVLEPLLPLASHVVVTAADHPRALSSAELAVVTRALTSGHGLTLKGHGRVRTLKGLRGRHTRIDPSHTRRFHRPFRVRTRPGSFRARPTAATSTMSGRTRDSGISGILIERAPSVAAALERARALAGPVGHIVVTGSLRTVGEAMIQLKIDATDN